MVALPKNIMSKIFLLLIVFVIISCKEDAPLSIADEKQKYIFETKEDPQAPLVGEKWIEWIRANYHYISSIQSESYLDLQFFKKLLADKKIVQLGESSHTTTEFSSAKVRLIKFLHEEMGFDVIAFESPIFECFYAQLTGGSPTNMMKNSIFYIWWSYEVLELFEYISKTRNSSHPLIITGFDIQISYRANYKATFMKNFFAKINAELGAQIYDLETKFKLGLVNSTNKDSVSNSYQNLLNSLNENWQSLAYKYSNNLTIPLMAKLSIISQIKLIEMKFSGNLVAQTKIRDKAMADNLLSLIEDVYKNKKIIVWAHNTHIMHDHKSCEISYMPNVNTMGYYIYQSYKQQLYTIGFYMYRGSSLTWPAKTQIRVKPSTSENIEAILYQTRKKFAFVDMEDVKNVDGNSWIFNEMKAKYWGGPSDEIFIPRNQYNGIFYVDETHPPSYIPDK